MFNGKHTEEAKARIAAAKEGEGNPNWKGLAAGYQAIHIWIRSHFEKTGVCEECHKERATEWANQGTLSRERKDWRELCISCHRTADNRARGPHAGYKLTVNDVREIRRLKAEGWTQQRLADVFGVSRTQIGNVVNGKQRVAVA